MIVDDTEKINMASAQDDNPNSYDLPPGSQQVMSSPNATTASSAGAGTGEPMLNGPRELPHARTA